MLNDNISYEKMCKMLFENNAQLIDVRSEFEFSQGALPDATNIPLQFITNAENLISDKTPIILYCVTGHRSSIAKKYLNQMGYDNVYDLGSYKNYCL